LPRQNRGAGYRNGTVSRETGRGETSQKGELVRYVKKSWIRLTKRGEAKPVEQSVEKKMGK